MHHAFLYFKPGLNSVFPSPANYHCSTAAAKMEMAVFSREKIKISFPHTEYIFNDSEYKDTSEVWFTLCNITLMDTC